MCKFKFTLDHHSLQTIYISFICPILEYGDIILNNCMLEQKVQYEAVRIVTGATKLVSLQKFLDEVCWDTLKHQKHKLLFYKMRSNITPF